jgi:ketosteroid isomerase-like protein
MWWRTTVCFRRIDNKWMITHQHASSSIPQRRRMFASVFDSIAAGIS